MRIEKYLVNYLKSHGLKLNNKLYQGLFISNLILVTILRARYASNGRNIDPESIYSRDIILDPNTETYYTIYNSDVELPSEETINLLRKIGAGVSQSEEFKLPLLGRVLLNILVVNLDKLISLKKEANTTEFTAQPSSRDKIFDTRETPSPSSSDESDGAKETKCGR